MNALLHQTDIRQTRSEAAGELNDQVDAIVGPVQILLSPSANVTAGLKLALDELPRACIITIKEKPNMIINVDMF